MFMLSGKLNKNLTKFRNSHQMCSLKKDVLRNFAKFTEVFSCEFCEISKNTFFTEHLWATASESCSVNRLNSENSESINLKVVN